ncbi:hypothetical protein [Rhodospira trueperi]|uniref:hypothetical protein n=1 Tax=Rhodospira trueperi TaxID=69960 RepID=UPI00115FE76C|nr:hypothetical protein [Rhodospira trueperi]
MARKLPDPGDRTANDPAVLCTKERVLQLYRNHTGDTASKMSQKVRSWFVSAAQEEGWDAALFLKDVETRHSAGCVLYKSPAPSIRFFIEGDESDDF